MPEMRYVGTTGDKEFMLAISENMFQESTFLLMLQGRKPKPKPPVPRRADYPPLAGSKPQYSKEFDIFEYMMGKQDFIWWRCGTYVKKQRGVNVWIDHYPPQVEAPGGGHRALRRLGWTAQYRRDGFVWVHRVHKELPWPVPSRSTEE